MHNNDNLADRDDMRITMTRQLLLPCLGCEVALHVERLRESRPTGPVPATISIFKIFGNRGPKGFEFGFRGLGFRVPNWAASLLT